MSIGSNVVSGFAQLLVADGIGSWDSSGRYDPAQTGIYDTVKPEGANRMITLGIYPISEDPSLSDSVTGLQVWTRMPGNDPRLVRDLDEEIFHLVQGMTDVDLVGGVHLVQCLFQSGGSMGQDTAKRWNWSSNYHLTLHRPSQHRT